MRGVRLKPGESCYDIGNFRVTSRLLRLRVVRFDTARTAGHSRKTGRLISLTRPMEIIRRRAYARAGWSAILRRLQRQDHLDHRPELLRGSDAASGDEAEVVWSSEDRSRFRSAGLARDVKLPGVLRRRPPRKGHHQDVRGLRQVRA